MTKQQTLFVVCGFAKLPRNVGVFAKLTFAIIFSVAFGNSFVKNEKVKMHYVKYRKQVRKLYFSFN